MKKYLILALVLVLLLACNLPIGPGAEKPLPTQQPVIIIVVTGEPAPTDTPQPTPAFTPTADMTVTTAPTLAPTADLRIIEGDPQDFLLQVADLPNESQFYLPDETWTSRASNNETLEVWGAERGAEYIARTGRIDGWWVNFIRGSERLKAPEGVYCEVVKYKTADGALLTVKEYNTPKTPFLSDLTWITSNDKFPELGNQTVTSYSEYSSDSGAPYTGYKVETSYYNFFVGCEGYGPATDVEPDYVAGLVEIIINKMKTANLVTPP